MSVTPTVVADDGTSAGRADVAVRRTGSFVESLVARLHAEYGDDPETIRWRVTQALARFAGAPVQAFVPILVEKRVRELYRRANAGRTALPA